MLIKSEIISLLNGALNQTVRLRKGGNQALYFCKCGHSSKRKLEICLEEGNKFGFFNCWVCGIQGNLGTLLKLFNVSKSYRDRLYQLTKDIRIIRRMASKTSPTEIILPEEFIPLSQPRNEDPEYRNAITYLKKRGILWEDIIRYNLGFCEKKFSQWEQHIIIPSYDHSAKLNFFIGRNYYNSKDVIFKPLSYKKPDRDMNIIGFELFINYAEPLVLVESPFNAITIRRNAIPLFGKFPSKKLYEAMIVNGVKTVYVCLDNDARDDAVYVCQQLFDLGITPYFVEFTGGKDPNEIGFEKITLAIRNAKEFTYNDLLRYKLKLSITPRLKPSWFPQREII